LIRYLASAPRALPVLTLTIALAASALASPPPSALTAAPGEIERAIKVAGASDSQHANQRQFLRGFTAVLIGVKRRDVPAYVTAAVTMRPDLAKAIARAALLAQGRNAEENSDSCDFISAVIRAAIAACPEAAAEIVRAAIAFDPQSRSCVVAAALSAAPGEKAAILQARTQTLAFLTVSALRDPGFSLGVATLNPANISDLGDNGHVNSPEQPPSP
jgi:hypothetical protein